MWELYRSQFNYPLNLHYSQTRSCAFAFCLWFNYPLNLHYSQTSTVMRYEVGLFNYPLNLHYSQTCKNGWCTYVCLITL